ncbi:MAG TPA: alpha/beta hydrolase [Frankiaceae bacterium]|jgi:pimeloyl-ACP methyl ester carboxylesterase|nr:alpha/beta hydrolase [Frankiaceae bacterium]
MDCDADAFTIHHADLSTGVRIAYVREGVGGIPLLLLHGYPETKRIWWRNIAPLAAAGFEVVVPDLRGYGDSGLAPDGFYDPAAYSRDTYELAHDVLGFPSVMMAAGDVGGVVMLDMAVRHPGYVRRQCFFNSVPPSLGPVYEEAGLAGSLLDDTHPSADYRIRQGRDGDVLAAELSTPELRRLWIAGMYGPRLWAAAGSFTSDEIDFHTEPFADAAKLRASWGPYELAYGKPMSELPLLFKVVDVPTMVLYGAEDHVVPDLFVRQCELAFSKLTGPFVIPRAGHFLQWERADLFNNALVEYLLPRQS